VFEKLKLYARVLIFAIWQLTEMDLIEMVPLVRKFDRKKDREKIKELAEKYGSKKGVKITWHYYVLMALVSAFQCL